LVAGLKPALKWPNDVFLNGRKAAGVLVEGQLAQGRPAMLVVGVGVHVGRASLPPGVAERATSLAHEADRPVPRAPLLAAFLAAFEGHLDALMADGGARLRAGWEARMLGRGNDIAVAFPGTPRPALRGRALGLAANGALRLDTPDG